MKHYTHREDCRLCSSRNFELVLPILPSAIGDAFVAKEQLDQVQELYPLDTYICLDCGHVQNLDVVDPDILFRNYTYRTSSSLGLVAHFQRYAESVVTRLGIPPSSLIVELGSNDGSLLKAFKSHGMRVLGVDPAKSIAQTATDEGIQTLPEFFSSMIATRIFNEYGLAQLVCANNVFAHADDIGDIVKGIRSILATDGAFVFEVSYVPDMVDKMVFDVIYHEHVSHHALLPLEKFFNRLDMTLFDVERVTTKGGSIRGFAQPKSATQRARSARLTAMLDEEVTRGVTKPPMYRQFFLDIEARKRAVLDTVEKAIMEGKTVAGYGASTTTTTLLYHFELQEKLAFIVDDNPVKYNLYSPGAHIPVLPSEELYSRSPDIVVILAWQYADAILKRHQKFVEQGGVFIVPLPDLFVAA